MAVELFFEVFFFKCALADKSSLAKLVVSVHCILWKKLLMFASSPEFAKYTKLISLCADIIHLISLCYFTRGWVGRGLEGYW